MNTKQKTALFAGSFDPFTNGHFDVLKQAAEIFDKVIIGIAINSNKKRFVPIADSINLIKQSVSGFANIEVISYNGLTADFARENGIKTLIRGIRNSADFKYEYSVAQTNNSINANINTVFFIPNPDNCYISSTIIRELAANNADISKYVPKPVSEYFKSNKKDTL